MTMIRDLTFVDQSALKSKLVGIAKVSVGESIEEAETGYTIEPGWNGRNADCAEILVECERWQANGKPVAWKRASVGAAECDRLNRLAATKQTVIFIEDELE